MPLSPSFPVHFVILALMFGDFISSRQVMLQLSQLVQWKELRKMLKIRTRKRKSCPQTSLLPETTARYMPAWSPLQDALPLLAVHPMGCSF